MKISITLKVLSANNSLRRWFFGILHCHLGVSSYMNLTCSWIQQSYVNLRPSQLNFAFWCTEKLKRMWNYFE